MGDDHVQHPSAHLARTGLTAAGLPHGHVPGLFKFLLSPESPETAGGKEVTQDIPERFRAVAPRAPHA